MNKNVLISVIMPVWAKDSARHFAEAVRSILEQSHSNLELIVAEDGPLTDELRDYLDETAKNDGRIRRVALESSGGPSAARNAGIAVARGFCYAFLDADDVANPLRIERQLGYLLEHRLDVCGSCYRVIDELGAERSRRRLPLEEKRIRRNAALVNPIGNSMLMGLAQVVGVVRYDEAIRYGEDYDLNIRLLEGGYKLGNVPEYLVDVRAGSGFLNRRWGLEPFRSDFRNRLRALRLAPFGWRVALFVPGLLLVAARLLPPIVLRIAYAVRSGLRIE